MAKHEVVPEKNGTFTVRLVMPGGKVKVVRGFASEHEANAWIIQADRLFLAHDPHLRVTPRDKPRR
jgi:hypothetical protein